MTKLELKRKILKVLKVFNGREEAIFDICWKEIKELKNRNAELKGMYAHNAREADRPQWHDLEKDPTDLPEDRRNVYVVYLNSEYLYDRTIASYRYKYWCIDGHKTECEIVAWYELPIWGK